MGFFGNAYTAYLGALLADGVLLERPQGRRIVPAVQHVPRRLQIPQCLFRSPVPDVIRQLAVR